MSITNDGGIINGGSSCDTSQSCYDKPYVMRLDSDMHVVWAKYYPIPKHQGRGGAQFGRQTADGGFILGFNIDSAGAVVAKTNSMGNMLWCKSYIRPKGYIHDCVVEPDGSCIITGYTDSVNIPPSGTYPPGFAPKLFMMKLDTAGSVLWAKAYDSDRHWLMSRSRIIKTNDGGYALFASVAYYVSIRPILIKTDANGDTLWTRIHGKSGSFFSQALSILQTSDNGYLLGGAAPYNGIQAWLYKTDSLGRTYCNELTQPTYVYDIYPTDSDIVMTSIDGATEVPISLSDSMYEPRNVWEDCPTNITYSDKSAINYTVRPNPSTGIFYFHNNTFDEIETTDVFNYLGEQIYYRAGKTEEINLTNSPKGIYFYKVSTKDGNVFSGKMVVH